MKTYFLAVAAAAVLASSSAGAVTTVLFDNFDQDALQLNWSGDAVFRSLALPGFRNQVSSTDLIGANFKLCSPNVAKNHCVDLDGTTGNKNNPAGKLQSVKILGKGGYTLTFRLSGNQRGFPAQTTVVALGDFSQSIALPSASPWATYSYTFINHIAGTNLTFTEQGPSDQRGNVLDDVLLTTAATPEPGSWAMMLAGFATAGAALRRRARSVTV